MTEPLPGAPSPPPPDLAAGGSPPAEPTWCVRQGKSRYFQTWGAREERALTVPTAEVARPFTSLEAATQVANHWNVLLGAEEGEDDAARVLPLTPRLRVRYSEGGKRTGVLELEPDSNSVILEGFGRTQLVVRVTRDTVSITAVNEDLSLVHLDRGAVVLRYAGRGKDQEPE